MSPRTATTPSPTRTEAPRSGARDLALVAVFTGLIVVLGLPGALYVFGGAVPITLQNLGIMLVAVLLGWRRATLSVLLLILLVIIGLPVLAGGRGSIAVFAGPTVGYLVGYVPAVMVAGWFAQRVAPRFSTAWAAVGLLLGPVLIDHLFGIAGMAWRAGLSLPAAATADLVFVPGDLAKVVVALVVATAVHRAVPGLLPARR